jgi:hypothetical protein
MFSADECEQCILYSPAKVMVLFSWLYKLIGVFYSKKCLGILLFNTLQVISLGIEFVRNCLM